MCQGTTKDGNPCKNKQEPFCVHHKAVVVPTLRFPTDHLTTKIRNKITKQLKHGPTKTDTKGFIYVYYHAEDLVRYFKIGRTEKSVETRLKQWGKKALLNGSWEVKCQKFAEKLIHTYLDAQRVYRYKIDEEKTYCTVWKSTGKPVTGDDEILEEKYKLEARKKHIEWFVAESWVTLKETIDNLLKPHIL